MEFISIIIPAYNSQRWLRRCLDSVMAAIDIECEVVIVDDGSIDSTPQIIKEYTDKDPRITSITTEHVGPCVARLRGLRESTGDYVMFVDSDDSLPLHSIQTLRHLLQEPTDEEMSNDYGNEEYRFTSEKPKIIIGNTVCRGPQKDTLMVSGKRRAISGHDLACEILTGSITRFLVGHLYSRELLEAIEWDENPVITQFEHAYMMLSLAMTLDSGSDENQNKRLVLIDPTRNVYHYLLRQGSQSSMMAPTHDGFELIWKHLSNLNLPEREFTIWGLNILRNSFIHRGIPFDNDFEMAVDLRRRAQRLDSPLPDDLKEVVDSLTSSKKRLKIARRLSRTANLNGVAPHMTFIVPTRGSIKKVRRTIKSIYDTGFRNIEVILVDTNENLKTSLELNAMNVTFPRIRIVRGEPGMPNIQANLLGLHEASGLAVMFLRAGDKVNGYGAYHALLHIDSGADLVLVNIQRFSPITSRNGNFESNVDRIEGQIDESVNYADALRKKLDEGRFEIAPRLRANLWRRETVLESNLPGAELDGLPAEQLAGATIRHILRLPIRVVVQSPDACPAYEIAIESRSILDHIFPKSKRADKETWVPTYRATDR